MVKKKRVWKINNNSLVTLQKDIKKELNSDGEVINENMQLIFANFFAEIQKKNDKGKYRAK